MIIPIPVSSENLNLFFTEALPEFMNKFGFKILSIEITILLPIVLLFMIFKFLIKFLTN